MYFLFKCQTHTSYESIFLSTHWALVQNGKQHSMNGIHYMNASSVELCICMFTSQGHNICKQYFDGSLTFITPVFNWCSLRDIHMIAVFIVLVESVFLIIWLVLTKQLELFRFVFRVLRNWAIVSENFHQNTVYIIFWLH